MIQTSLLEINYSFYPYLIFLAFLSFIFTTCLFICAILCFLKDKKIHRIIIALLLMLLSVGLIIFFDNKHKNICVMREEKAKIESYWYKNEFEKLKEYIKNKNYKMILVNDGEIIFDNIDSFLSLTDIDFIVNDKEKTVYANDLGRKGDPQIIWGSKGTLC